MHMENNNNNNNKKNRFLFISEYKELCFFHEEKLYALFEAKTNCV